MFTSAGRRLIRVQLTTLPKLMQQTSAHWDQVDQALQTDEMHLECVQQRLKVLQQILTGEPTLTPEHCTILLSKVEALVNQEERLHRRIALERARCQLLEQVFEDAQRAQSILLKQREKTHRRCRQHLQHLLGEIFTQVQHAAVWLAQGMPSGIQPPI